MPPKNFASFSKAVGDYMSDKKIPMSSIRLKIWPSALPDAEIIVEGPLDNRTRNDLWTRATLLAMKLIPGVQVRIFSFHKAQAGGR